ncbi:type II secretion system F family protein [Lederbergia citrea]|uniref:Type II secretion system F family protein n=1 Tax=Lederbergia citrea TaxID=2833581 RepID=A0A942UVZ2_9BACI|nr:type II secretion system F family protein [Lederbergia citrea]MBS4179498.1 type II secretion system F family protein [Lederbergia citrea]MBS4206165.1 type II secretion system F family protein [Lederbergia citrea]MBS4224899.1 type II secretion system F family protein [Lederbergia citrea]
MDALIILSVILFWFMIILTVRHSSVYIKEKRQLLEHVSEIAYTDAFEKKKKQLNRRVVLFQKMTKYADEFADLGQRINFFSENQDVAVLLKKSGNKYQLTVARFQGMKIFLLIVGFFAGAMSFMIGLPFSQYAIIIFPIIGYFIPIITVRNQAKKRQEALRLDLPDFLDTISTSLHAGVSLDQALKEVIRFFDGPLREEFSRFNYEVDLGVPRETAYRNLLDRNDNQEFQGLIKALIQGQKLGVPIATTFKIQAEALRQIREEQIKELAAKASPKVTLVTTFVVAPVSILIIAGLMLLNLIYGENSIFTLF